MNKEIWKDIEGFDGKYQVSNLGNVKSLKGKQERILTPSDNGYGYYTVHLRDGKKGKQYYIHRLVASVFIPNPNNLPQVNHKDEDKSNNELSNLEWCDSKYNNNYGTKNKRISESRKGKYCGKDNPNYGNHKLAGKNNPNYGKPISQEQKQAISEAHSKAVYCIELDKTFDSATKASEEIGINRCSIGFCCRGKYKSAGGYHWKYVA